MDVIMEFATPIGMFYTSDETLTTDIYSKILALLENKNEDVFEFDHWSKTTTDDLNTKEQLLPLVDYIEKHTKNFSEEVLGIDKNNLRLSSMWANAHNSGSKHHFHEHPNAFVSGVYYPYIHECKDPGNIVFLDPRHAKNNVHADFTKSSCISNRNIWVTPESGLLLLFPSWLQHGTDPFLTDNKENKRVAISFNYQLISCSEKTMRI